jgi:hypothetical protein
MMTTLMMMKYIGHDTYHSHYIKNADKISWMHFRFRSIILYVFQYGHAVA